MMYVSRQAVKTKEYFTRNGKSSSSSVTTTFEMTKEKTEK